MLRELKYLLAESCLGWYMKLSKDDYSEEAIELLKAIRVYLIKKLPK